MVRGFFCPITETEPRPAPGIESDSPSYFGTSPEPGHGCKLMYVSDVVFCRVSAHKGVHPVYEDLQGPGRITPLLVLP
jgi:hypothetical protein